MALIYIQSSMAYAKTLLPETLVRSVLSMQTTITQCVVQCQPRPFKVCTHSRRQRKCLMATSIGDLLDKMASAFLLTCQVLTLVLEEDGTVVDSEAFFQSLPTNTQLMVLGKGEEWTPNKNLPSFKQSKIGIAKLSVDLYKLNPKDFIGCLTIKAKLHDTYTISYDIKCLRAKHMLRSLLHCLMNVIRVAGHLLLYVSSYMLQCIRDDY